MVEIKLVESDDEIMSCFDVAVQLRTQYNRESFVKQVQKQMLSGYQLVSLKSNNEICALAGFRYSENLAWGKFLYVDDLITSIDHRSKGYGKKLLAWLIQQAEENECQQLELDSGVQRKDAHRFYLREKMRNSSLHFSISLP